METKALKDKLNHDREIGVLMYDHSSRTGFRLTRVLTKLLGAISILIFATACVQTHEMVPVPDTHELDPILEFSSSNSIALVNVQENDTVEEYSRNGSARFVASYRQWTDVIISILSRELSARGMIIDDNAEKKIELAVVNGITEIGFWRTETQAVLEASLGDGYDARVVGINNNTMGAANRRQVDGALMRAVAQLLNDPKVIAYLED